MTQECKKPKDTLFFKWVKKHGSVGDLGPGYPIDYFAGEPTKFFKFLVKLGIPGHKISRFDYYRRQNRRMILAMLFGGISFLACAVSYLRIANDIVPWLLALMLISGAVFMSTVTRLIWRK
jgi:hypothetical protein